MFPTICSSEVYGTTSNFGVLPDGIPLPVWPATRLLFRAGLFQENEMHLPQAAFTDEHGNTPIRSENGLLTSVGWRIGDDVLRARGLSSGKRAQWPDGLSHRLSISHRRARAERRRLEATSACNDRSWYAILESDARGLICGLPEARQLAILLERLSKDRLSKLSIF